MEVRRDPAQSSAEAHESPSPRHPRRGGRDHVDYRLARSRAEFEGAFRILQRRYEESGLTLNRGARLRVMPYHLWPETQVFVAVDDHQQVIGSVSLVRDEGNHRLPMESTYPSEIAGLRSNGVVLGEVCGLCVGSEKSHSSGEMFAGLTRIMMFHARYRGLDSLVAVVHPRHGKFYRLAMGFQEIGGLSAYRQVGGQPGVPIMGHVKDDSRYRDRWKRNYFGGGFTEDQLLPSPMSMIDRAYFGKFLEGAERSSQATIRRAA